MADRVTVICRLEVCRMRPAIHIDNSIRIGSTHVQNVNALQIRNVDEFRSIGRRELPRDSGSLAPRVRFELINLPLIVDCSGPGLEWDLIQLTLRQRGWPTIPAAGLLAWDGTDPRFAIGP